MSRANPPAATHEPHGDFGSRRSCTEAALTASGHGGLLRAYKL